MATIVHLPTATALIALVLLIGIEVGTVNGFDVFTQ